MPKLNNGKLKVTLLLSIMSMLILGAAYAVFQFQPLKASEQEASLVSTRIDGKKVQEVTETEAFAELTAKEDLLLQIPYEDTYAVTLLDENGDEQVLPLLDQSELEQMQADPEPVAESEAEMTDSTEASEAAEAPVTAYQVGTADQGSYYVPLAKGETISLRIQKQTAEEVAVKVLDANDTTRQQTLFTFVDEVVASSETEEQETNEPQETEESESTVTSGEPETQETTEGSEVAKPGSTREAVQLSASIDNEKITDGTPGWDDDDEPGNDSGPSNGIVRSFDTITYPLQMTVNPSGLKNVVLKISGKLKNGVYKDRVQAVFDEGGNQDPLKDGEVNFTKNFTIANTGSAVTFPVNVNVLGAFNGVDLTLTDVVVEIVSIDGVNQTTPIKVTVPDTKPIKTSSQVSFNIKATTVIANASPKQSLLKAMVVNKELDDPYIYVSPLNISLQAIPLPNKTDNKGSSFPAGEIKYTIESKKTIDWDDGIKEIIPTNQVNKIKILDYRAIDFVTNDAQLITQHGPGSVAAIEGYDWKFASIENTVFANSFLKGDRIFSSVVDSGKLLLMDEIATGIYEFLMTEYKIGSTFPKYRADGWDGQEYYSKTEKAFATWQHLVMNVNEYYAGSDLNPDEKNNNELIDYVVKVQSYKDEDGYEVEYLKEADASTNIRNTIGGTLSINNAINDLTTGRQFGTKQIDNGAIPFGDGMAISGTRFQVYGYSNQDFTSHGTREVLMNWNTDSFAYIDDIGRRGSFNSLTGRTSLAESMWSYGIAKKSNFNSLSDLGNARIEDYDWYSNLGEAKSKGEIGALKIKIEDEPSLPATAAVMWYYHLQLKTQKLGSLNNQGTPNVAIGQYWVDATGNGDIFTSNQPVTRPAMYDDENKLVEQQVPRGAPCRFDTLAVTDMVVRTNIKSDKTNYDSTERQKFTIDSSFQIPESFQGEAPVTLTVTIPKGLSVIPSTVMYGGKPVDVELVYNADGTTTMSYTTAVKSGEKIQQLTYEANINNADMNYTSAGLASVVSKVVISSPYDTSLESLRTATVTTNVTKIGQLGISQTIDPTKIEVNGTFAISILPYTTTAQEQGVTGIWNLPENEDENKSEFEGTIAISKVESIGTKVKRIYLNKARQTETNPNKINLSDGWEPYEALSSDISAYKSVYYVFDDIITSADKNIGVKVTMQTEGNVPDNYYRSVARGNSDTNYAVEVESNMVQAIVVGRSLSGVAWYDTNLDGLIDDGEPIAANIPVKLYRTSAVETGIKDQLVKENLAGEPFVDAEGNSTVLTDDKGYYEFTKLPEGTYVAEFMVGDQIQRQELKITKELVGEDEAINSKANPETCKTPGYLAPILQELNGLYQIEYVNVGLIQPSEIRLFKYETGTAKDLDGDGQLSESEKATGLPLVGAEFAIYAGTEVTGQPIGTATTDVNGNLVFDKLFPGDYTLVETKAPTGYELIKTPISVTIDQSNQVIQLYADDPKQTLLPFTGGANPTQLVILTAASLALVGMLCLGYTYLQPKKGRRAK